MTSVGRFESEDFFGEEPFNKLQRVTVNDGDTVNQKEVAYNATAFARSYLKNSEEKRYEWKKMRNLK